MSDTAQTCPQKVRGRFSILLWNALSGNVPKGENLLVTREADACRAAGGGQHPADGNGGIQHPAAQLLVAALNGAGKGLKLRGQPGAAAVEVVVFLFAVVEVQRQAAAVVGRGFLQQIALGALNDIPSRGPAVFCRHAHGLEAAVIHGQDAAGVNAVVDVGRVVHPVGLPEQAHDVSKS